SNPSLCRQSSYFWCLTSLISSTNSGGMSTRSSPFFHEGFEHGLLSSNMRLQSSDGIIYHLHRQVLLEASDNGFCGLCAIPTKDSNLAVMEDSSEALNIILATVYGMAYHLFTQSLSSVIAAIDLLPVYGLAVSTYMQTGSGPAEYLCEHAASSPLLIYALASRHNLEAIAVFASSYLLNVELTEVLTEEIARLIAPEYLERLLDMRHTRIMQLYDMLFEELPQHAILAACGSPEYRALTLAWTLVSCDDCKRMVLQRIERIVAQWDNLKVRIGCTH
ncbi:hypothetical protein CPB85DRAFT_1315214, partial [Mucidula mucida]